MPEEISLVGYDDIFFSEILDVPLTTVSQPVYDMGVEAVQQLISEIGSGVNSQKCITFQPRLVVRESTVERSDEKSIIQSTRTKIFSLSAFFNA